MDIESRLQALKARVVGSPKIPLKEIEHEIRELMAAGVRCRRFTEEVGLSTYVIYKIRKSAGISRPPRARKKFREVSVVNTAAADNDRTILFNVSIRIANDDGELKITGECSDVAALLKEIL